MKAALIKEKVKKQVRINCEPKWCSDSCKVLICIILLCSLLYLDASAQAPTITSFAPVSGPIGTTVTIIGTNFDTTPANNLVMFNGTSAIVTTSSATSITAIVPTGATTGPVSVTVGANTASSTSIFTVAPFNIAFTAPLSVTVGSTPREVVVGDIDADGHQDLIVSNFGSGSISFLKGIGNGCFESAQNFNTGPNSHGLALADVNQDSNLDLIVTKGNISSSSLAVLLGNEIAFGPQSNYSTAPTPRSPNHVNVGDIDKDGWPDILVANQNPLGSFSILYNNGNGTFAAGVDFPSANGSAFFVATDDVNGDTFPDVAIANFFTGRASIFLNDGLGGFASETTYPSAAGSHYVVLKDLNGDGRPEMIVANAIANSISVFLNNGSGLFLAPMIYPTENYPTSLSVADMDNDGKLDLVVGNANSGTITAFSGDGAGGFGASKNFSVGGQPYSIATGDFDEDGNLDVVSVDLSSNKITLLRTLSNTCLPNIASFSPLSGPTGTLVVISGMNFSSIPANNVVMFNGTTAFVTASTSTSITTTVPIGATTGNITLMVGANTATSTNSFCVPPNAPTPINNSGCSGTSISIGASGGTNGQYRWYTMPTGGTVIVGEADDTYTTPTLTGTTSFFVSINDGACESTRTEVIATILPLPVAPIVSPINPVCPGSSLPITASGGVNGDYRWYDGTTLLTGEVNSTYLAANITATRNLSVSIFDGSCESLKTAATITLKNCTPPVIASTTATAFLEGTVTIDLCPLLSDPENDLDLSTLQAIGILTSGAPFVITGCTLSINYAGIPLPGTDELTIRVCDLTGLCTDQSVSIELSGDIEVFNALSPNGDGRNDTFHIEYISILPETKNNKVQVYNRWGDLVWEAENYDNTERVFTGLTTSGKELPSGTYFYKLITARSSKTGFISLKR